LILPCAGGESDACCALPGMVKPSQATAISAAIVRIDAKKDVCILNLRCGLAPFGCARNHFLPQTSARRASTLMGSAVRGNFGIIGRRIWERNAARGLGTASRRLNLYWNRTRIYAPA